MKFENVNIKDLISPDYNPRIKLKPGDKEYEKIKTSIEKFGYVDPIIINQKNIIIGGNQRTQVLKNLNYDKINVIRINVNEKDEKALNIALNKISGEWDFEKLNNLLIELKDEFTGFDTEEFKQLEKEIKKEVEEVEEIKEVEEVEKAQQKDNIKKGDLYNLGKHKLICGDCIDKNILKQLKDFNVVLTDPPYGINIVKSNGTIGSGKITKVNKYKKIEGDTSIESAKKFYDLIKHTEKIMLFGGNYFDFLPFSASWLIWDKREDMVSNDFADGEMVWCNFHTRVRIYHQLWNGMIKKGETEKRLHPTQKPVKMLSDIIKNHTNENDIILDGFGGSGSILLACEQTNRICYTIELSEDYCHTIIKRWESLTGLKAVKEGD